ncbi:hypothetical protein LCGC14_0520470 [marine sediment metagenome]|uniref:Uncharacterized protein n=1 Tax=marine sediment metagenome TaxID=412755 RepID=A0A0F9S3E9_9ZZZZ
MRKLTYTTEFGGGYGEVSINLLEEESEKILGIKIGLMGPFHLRNDDIDELHDKIHECIEARETFAKLAAQGMGGWNDQPDPEAAETESISDSALGMLRMMGKGSLVHDNVEGGRCRYAEAVATLPEEHLEELRSHRLVEIVGHDELNSRCTWGISTEGAAYLAEQEG